jgi:hypothetical protein
MQSMRDSDPVAAVRADVFAAWAEELSLEQAYQTADLIAMAERSHAGPDENGNPVDRMDHPKLQRAFLAIAAGSGLRATKIDNTRLGIWLRGQQGRVSEGLNSWSIAPTKNGRGGISRKLSREL